MNDITVPNSPFGAKLRGRRAIALYHLQDDSPQAIRRISALMGEVRPENRIPHGIDGDGQPFSYTGWLDDYQRARAKYLVSPMSSDGLPEEGVAETVPDGILTLRLPPDVPPIVLYNTLTTNDPTPAVYNSLDIAYNFFDARLLSDRLPPCLITLQRGNKRYYGHYRYGQFLTRDGQRVTDEISLNLRHLRERALIDTLGTLVHEMVHCWQHHYGTPPRNGYHDKQWAVEMRRVGLIPSSTGAPGGRPTGQSMSHYPEPGGMFERAVGELLANGFILDWGDAPEADKARKRAGRLNYSCASCDINVRGKPGLHLICGDCRARLEPSGVRSN
jgi:hypothetical protein